MQHLQSFHSVVQVPHSRHALSSSSKQARSSGTYSCANPNVTLALECLASSNRGRDEHFIGKIMGPLRTTRTIQIIAIILLLSCCLATLGCNGLSSGGTGNQAKGSSYSVSGTITGVGGATLTLSGTATGTATADASGNYTFSGLANGSYTITPAKTGFVFSPSKETATVNGADMTGMDFGAAPSQLWNIQGTITPAGSGKNATVTLGGAADAVTTADGSGNYVFSGLPSGSYTVTPAKAQVIFTPYSPKCCGQRVRC